MAESNGGSRSNSGETQSFIGKYKWALVGAALVVAVVGFLLFRPDKAFVDDTVDEQLSDDIAALIDESTTTTTPPTTAAPTTTSPAAGASGAAPSSSASTAAPTTAAPTTAAPSGPQLVSQGQFTSLDHPTTGTVAIVEDNGKLQLVISDLNTDNGPDLKVYLSPRGSDSAGDSSYEDDAISLGALKGNVGTQTYEIPEGTDVASIKSVAIWCQRFSVGFGVAPVAA